MRSAEAMKPNVSLLKNWLDRATPLPQFVTPRFRRPDLEVGCWVALDIVIEAHECRPLLAQSLENSWHQCRKWVTRCERVMGARISNWLDREQADAIRQEIGLPPDPCYPIYVFSVEEGKRERAVYIGRTSAEHGRFLGGHDACSKLLSPKFDGMRKRLYLGCVSFVCAREAREGFANYLPLEWIDPLGEAVRLLKLVETQLIYDLQPELNVQGKKRFGMPAGITAHVQNFISTTAFLNDRHVFP